MPADLVIRGGTVYDGSGAPGRAADVAITDGVIREIGPNLRGETELDASGCAVAPGFIDIHTHYDAQVFWDPALRPSSYHGVTTVVAGNCGFAIAPTRPEHHDVIVRTLENVEDMDPATLAAGVAWDFETFPEYLDSVHRRGTTPELHRVRRPLRAAALRDGRRRVRARGDGRRDRAHVRARPRGDRRGRRRVLDELLVRAPRRRRQAGAEPLRRAGRGRRALPCGRCDGQGRRAHHAGRAVHATPTCTSGSRRSGGRSPIRCSPRPAAGTSSRCGCTRRAWRTAPTCGRRSRPGRSRCSSRWPTRTASTPARCSASCCRGAARRASPRTAIPSGGRERPPTWSSRR